jgi:hypothetical protein
MTTGPGDGGGPHAELATSLVPFLLNCCAPQLAAVLLAPDPDQPYGVPISFLELADENVSFAEALLRSPKPVLRLLDQALLVAQQRMTQTHPDRYINNIPSRRSVFACFFTLRPLAIESLSRIWGAGRQ